MASYSKLPSKKYKQGYVWKCVLEGPPHPVTGERKQIPRRGKTKTEALGRCQEEYNKLAQGIDTKVVKATAFKDASKKFLVTYSKSGFTKSTVRKTTSYINIINKFIGNHNVDRHTNDTYQEFINKLDEMKDKHGKKRYARGTLININSAANMVFEWCIKMKLRTDNPCYKVTIPKKPKTVEEIKRDAILEKYLERDEIEEFLQKAKTHGIDNDYKIFKTMLFGGMRPGEMCALEWPDVNNETYMCDIHKTIYHPTNNRYVWELTPPKNDTSVRIFDFDEIIIRMLEELKEEQKKIHERYKEYHDDFHEGQFILSNADGRPFTTIKLLNRMHRIVKMTSIKKDATPHIWRHTHISMLTEAGVPLPVIMQRVGHKDAKTTMEIYTHVTNRMKANVNQSIKTHFGKILKDV
ncbi:tyrosine-type recombinase/integrase [Paenibacillus sp. NPDC058177]|uniref:tyrosine-type recombinase/integrase n=1 Tax=Paenibacillus sp. NPDC058177 TaxID=3346369 RepID=UPI0036DCC5A6